MSATHRRVRVTDLEKFSLENVWRPYWLTYDRGGVPRPVDIHGRLNRLTTAPMDLDCTADELLLYDNWSCMVVDRLAQCGFWFPDYIHHRFRDVVEVCVAGWWADRRAEAAAATG